MKVSEKSFDMPMFGFKNVQKHLKNKKDVY